MPADRDQSAPLDYLPSWYRAQQAAQSMLDHDPDHPLRDASLEMLGRVMLFALAVAAVALATVLWWLV